jgi:RhtB (resistance to homoserine/threonine) family protein
MDHLTSLLAVAVVSLIAAISPGPDFFIVLKNSLSYSRKAGVLTALGVSVALVFHLSYTIMGIGIILAESPFIYNLIKYTGVAYLFYIGLNSWISSFKSSPSLDLAQAKLLKDLSSTGAFRQGFLTNLLNPKAAIFFISLFSQFIDSNTPTFLRIEYAFVNWFLSLGWFLMLAYLVTIKGFTTRINRFQLYIDRIMGSALMLLGMKLLLV